uniref:Myoglobin n=1 Tax=Strix occidentalis caurina TaxID=311401 RepID=A0A8D0EYX6_STROC
MSSTEAEVQSARGVWDKVYVDAEDNGTAVLIRMFTDHPDTKTYFTHFKGMDSTKEMKQSDQVGGHSKMVFTAINNMTHATQLKTDPKNFRVSQQPSSQGLMEEKFGRDCKASFEKVANEICTHLNNVYKEVS